MKRQHLLKQALLFSLLFLLITGVGFANAQDDDPTDDDTTTETEDEDDDDHDLDHHRDDDGTLWIESDVMTAILHSEMPSYQFWYSTDNNGSLARFMVSYMMVVEFEDQNGDGVYQTNETIGFAPLDAFEWILQTGSVTNELDQVTEVFASYTKGGLTGEDWEDDYFEDWMPGYGESEDPEDGFFLADGDGDLNLSIYEGMTLQFYAHMYMEDFNGTVEDDEGIQAEYSVLGGVELKIDVEIGNFPFQTETSKVAVLNYLIEDVASDLEADHLFRLHEDVGDDDFGSEDEFEHSDDNNLGEEFEDDDENNDGEHDEVQELSLIETSTNTTRGFYRWLDKAVMTLPNGSQSAVDVGASYWADGNGLLLFMAYPNFDGGSILHDPSMRFVESSAPIVPWTGVLGLPTEYIAVGGAAIVALVVLGLVYRRR
ncbi:MAG: hypothetical protein ACXAEB_04335 [Candidatus Thorarchaeota archaeon]